MLFHVYVKQRFFSTLRHALPPVLILSVTKETSVKEAIFSGNAHLLLSVFLAILLSQRKFLSSASRKMHSGSKISLQFFSLEVFHQEIKINLNAMIIVVNIIIGIIILENKSDLRCYFDWFQERIIDWIFLFLVRS